jgi:phosphohistidine swiveling domain-containing protein
MKTDQRPILEKYFERVFMLATSEIWNRAEKTSRKAWTSAMQPNEPYVVAEWNGTTTTYFYDFNGVAWVKEELRRRADEDQNFLDWLYGEAVSSYDKLKPLLSTEEPLPVSRIAQFAADVEYAWNILEATWWLVEDAEERKELETDRFKKALAGRVYADQLVPAADALLETSFKHAYPSLGQLVRFLLLEEASSGSIPSKEVLEEREKINCLINGVLYSGTRIEELAERMNFSIKQEITEPLSNIIKGTCAQKGLARGVVCIIRSRAELGKFKEGNILVSPTTTPDLMPAIIRCAAIVADEGGLVSHAAITSRELKKPCVIGTKIATQVLKDGDMVEVDADKGTVTILK